jgi:hypothetical protein
MADVDGTGGEGEDTGGKASGARVSPWGAMRGGAVQCSKYISILAVVKTQRKMKLQV